MDNDAKIKELLKKVEDQRKALGTKPKAAWQTNGIFKYDGSKHFNLNITKADTLVNALAFLLEKQQTRFKAAQRLGVDSSELEWEGYTIKEYEEDFKLRLSIIQWEDKKKQLQKTEKTLNSLVSEEARTEMELEKIAALLNG